MWSRVGRPSVLPVTPDDGKGKEKEKLMIQSCNICKPRCGAMESGGNVEQSPGQEVGAAWACDENRGALRRKEGDGNGSTREKEERKT